MRTRVRKLRTKIREMRKRKIRSVVVTFGLFIVAPCEWEELLYSGRYGDNKERADVDYLCNISFFYDVSQIFHMKVDFHLHI